MVVFIILLYIMTANGLTVPVPCFVAAWVLVFMKAIYSLISAFAKYSDKQ